jgi:peptidoglycan/xylan/chitin deacetylase (PgdA/CDA1 family)/uncharacterized caspase-like protein
MTKLITLSLFNLLLLMSNLSFAKDELNALVVAHQKMLLLLENAKELDPLDLHVHSARNFYQQKNHYLDQIFTQAEKESESIGNQQLLPITQKFITYYKNTHSLLEGDKLAFADLADELLMLEQERNVPSQGLIALKQINADIDRLTNLYREEYRRVLNKLGKQRGSKELWHAYIIELESLYKDNELLSEVKKSPTLHLEKTRGSSLVESKKDQLTGKLAPLIWGNGLPEKTVVLTFDDGPHRLRTAKILDTLNTYGVKGYFFAVGKNLGTVKNGIKLHKRNKAIIKRITSEGHILANHSFSHKELTKLSKEDKTLELSSTNQLIKSATGFDNYLYRPPYGSKNQELEIIAKEQGLSNIMWNVDSMDWADPIPESINERVFKVLDKKKRGILLFHDIHKQTVNALPALLEGLAQRGYRVVTVDGSPFTHGHSGIPKLPEAEAPELYKNSWAVVIGVNKYKHWPKLDYAVSDASSIARKLHENFGFEKENIIELYDENATRDNIAEVLGYTLADPRKIGKDDRVFIFYAGHGATRKLPSGSNLGYLIPVDAEFDKFQTKSISMSMLNDFSSLIPAKHVYFVMDSCYSGLALTRAGGGGKQNYNYLEHITNRTARQIITAGGADQEVSDGGPGGHSIFTWTLLQALDGKADTDNNGYITASEIGTYVSPVVASYAPQTPAFGNLLGSQGGDFVFKLNQESKTRSKKEADQAKHEQVQVLAANTHDLSSDIGRPLELQKTRSAKDKTVTKSNVSLKDNKRVQAAHQADAEALKLYKKGDLIAAEKKWAKAVKLNPYNINIVNNYGFVLDKLDRNDEALIWYYRTVELDPKRTPIYLNLGDIMVKLGKSSLAIPYYQRYLHLYPSYKKANELQEKIDKLSSDTIYQI